MTGTPKNITAELDKYIVGQDDAKKAVAVALRNRERRRKLDAEMRQDVMPKNIILIGPTGVGKTEIARRMAAHVNAPFLKIEATKFTEVGYVGRDVETIVAELVETTVNREYDSRVQEAEPRAEVLASERLLEYVCQQLPGSKRKALATATGTAGEQKARQPAISPSTGGARRRNKVAARLKNNELEDQFIEIEIAEEEGPFPEDRGIFIDGQEDFPDGREMRLAPGQRRKRKVSVKEARRILTREEAAKLIDFDQIVDHALHEVEENGVIFLDELDKLVGPRIDVGRDVSGEGVQRDLLPLVEGTTVMTRYGPVKTDHILFVAAGCFYQSKPSDLIPELQGRFPLRVELKPLSEDDLAKILAEPKNALTRQYTALLATEGVSLRFTDDGIREMARLACIMNNRSDNIGARRLNTIMEKVLEDLNFSAPEHSGETVTVDATYVGLHIGNLVRDENLSRFIL